MRVFLRLSCLTGLLGAVACQPSRPEHLHPVDGAVAATGGAASVLDAAVDAGLRPRAKNLVLFLGDGMGPEQLATGRVAVGRPLRLDALRGPAFVNTDSLSTREHDVAYATDSAAAATAIATGVLVHDGVVSQTPDGKPLETVLEVFARAGRATGLVTTSYFYDASPAAFAAHAAHRYEDARDIVRDMMNVTRPDVVMGHPGYDLTPAELAAAVPRDYFQVNTPAELRAWDPRVHPRLLGLFATDFVSEAGRADGFSFTPELARTPSSPDPTLAFMTTRALDRLARDPDGFFLFVEDEIFDQLGHGANPDRAWINAAYPPQALGFDAAVGVAIDWVIRHSSFEETLIVVTADHETGGYVFDHALGSSSGELLAGGLHTRTPVELRALGPGSEAVMHAESHLDTHALLLGRLE